MELIIISTMVYCIITFIEYGLLLRWLYQKLNDVKFPDINFDPNCTVLKQLKYTHVASKHVSSIRSICQSMKPLITLLKQKKIVL